MKIYRKRNGGLEIDYLVLSLGRYTLWITKSIYVNKWPRLVLWKMSKEVNVGTEKSWSWSIK